jgi:hypothetical protein
MSKTIWLGVISALLMANACTSSDADLKTPDGGGAGGGAAGAAGGAGAGGEAGRTPGTGGAVGGAGVAGSAGTGGALGGTGGRGGTAGAQVSYAGTIVNPINSGDEVIFRRIEPSMGLCVLVDVFIQVGGKVSGPISAYALPTDAAGCLTATTTNHVMATGSTGTITSPDQGAHFDIDLNVTFPDGMDWLGPSVDFKVTGLPLDGVWYPGP